ncbi:ABC transporter permease [Paenibacillus psychroresistens]|uniref:ABC transporter permease n=1 Tax=Paenibacillus psychroresistens TaxID=1778678 RepID=A0A6B8RTA4_9BACL|nr:ABC transporter permease [Paenibacillus psychroresistens]QGQ99149.1 ABC transporter permease [Paenibacillus psychroresistens]
MVNLIRNENMKIYRRVRTWIMIGFMIFLLILVNSMERYNDGKDAQKGSWQESVAQDKQSRLEILKQKDLDEENRKFNEEQVAIFDYHLEHNIQTENNTMWDGINGSAGLIILITLFTAIVAGDSLAGEFASGTIKLLLIRPASRLKILVSKYISVILFGILLLIILFIVSVVINGILYGFKDINLPLIGINTDGEVVERSMVANLWKTYLFSSVSTVMIVSIAFMISSAFRSSAMAIGFSLFSLFAGTIASNIIQRFAWSKYFLFANIDLTQHLNGHPYQEGMTLAFSIVVLSVYFIVFNLVSWLVFTKRDVAA